MTAPGDQEVAPSGSKVEEGFSWLATWRLAVWLALAAGLLEGLYRWYRVGVRGWAIGMSPHVIWMAPVANLLWLLVPLLLIMVVFGLFRWRRQVVPVFVLLMTALLGLVLLYQSMHKAAALLLSAGLAWHLTPRVIRSTRFQRLVRRTLPILAALAMLGGVGIAVSRTMAERRMMGALAAATPGRPNILLIVWDTVRDFNMSASGYGRPTTPFMERFAGQGARFDLAIATAPWTLPSHAGMFSGQRATVLGAQLNTRLDDKYPLIAEAFARAGYATGGFTANMSYVSREHGLARGFSRFRDFRLSPSGIIGSSRLGIVLLKSAAIRRVLGYYDLPGRKSAAIVNREFLDWVEGQDQRPFFGFLNYFEAHQPYLPSQPFRSRFAFPTTVRYQARTIDVRFEEMTAEEIRWSMGGYDGAIAYQDAQVERLILELERRGLLENTIVVITSDHGEHFGDHRRISHGNSLYRQLLQVPLVIRFPGRVPGGTVVTRPISLADLPQTLFDLSDVRDSAVFPGRSLARFWAGSYQPDSTEVVVSESPTASGAPSYSLIANGYHYIRWLKRPPQLYRLDDDPEETRDLAGSPSAAAVLREFAALEARFTSVPQAHGRPAQ